MSTNPAEGQRRACENGQVADGAGCYIKLTLGNGGGNADKAREGQVQSGVENQLVTPSTAVGLRSGYVFSRAA
jgi:hypothetical protein